VASEPAAITQVRALEQGANAAGLAAYLAPDAHVYRAGRNRGVGASAAAELAYPNIEVSYQTLRAEGSEAGDLVFTLGDANWVRDGTPRRGYYMRLWQYRPEGWRIVYDQLLGRAPPPS
jgi:Domain of unknown function (DUF4440)